jgi:hypothetical protein
VSWAPNTKRWKMNGNAMNEAEKEGNEYINLRLCGILFQFPLKIPGNGCWKIEMEDSRNSLNL